MKTSAAVCLLLALVVSGANAQVAVNLYGAGAKQCGVYLADRQKDNDLYDGVVAVQFAQWAYGFISAHNTFASKQQINVEQLQTATVIAYIDKYCRDNPLTLVASAVSCLLGNYGGPTYPYCK